MSESWASNRLEDSRLESGSNQRNTEASISRSLRIDSNEWIKCTEADDPLASNDPRSHVFRQEELEKQIVHAQKTPSLEHNRAVVELQQTFVFQFPQFLSVAIDQINPKLVFEIADFYLPQFHLQ